MVNVNCAVVGCSNSTYQLKKWKGKVCEKHGVKRQGECGCDVPFKLYNFPSELRNGEARERWVNLMKREGPNKAKWLPTKTHVVCSLHFVDGIPTPLNPDPTLDMGYDLPAKKPRRELFRQPHTKRTKRKAPSDNAEYNITTTSDFEMEESSTSTAEFLSPSSELQQLNLLEHSYARTPSQIQCEKCIDKENLIESMVRKINRLTLKVKQATREKLTKSSTFTWRKITNDKKMNFYTGLSSIVLFNTVFLLLKPYLPKLNYWRGPKHARSYSKVKRRAGTSNFKILSHRDEFLLTLMRLRLGLMNEDLADRFGCSTTTCSNTFTTWIKVISQILGHVLVAWLPREAIRDNLPDCFKKLGHSKCRVILDCAEVFIERPKGLDNQAATWSDYKHHNTIKFLVGISPSGYITFLSDCYGGRASDKFITSDSNFYDLIERDDEIMADRGFQIREDLLLRYCSLSIPPGARVKSQFTKKETETTKEVANLRIHVERAINRIKTFRILKSVIPITLLHNIDDIVLSCAALCNLKPRLIVKTK